MALHPDFPASPYAIPRPDQRWFPASEDLRTTAYENLLPPLVASIRDEVSAWRDAGYEGASATEHYADYLQLGIEEWRKSFVEHEKLGKKAVLFVMVDDTRNCDEVGAYLEKICPELQGGVLVIHTKKKGDLSNYVPDFIVRSTDGTVWIVETKGRAELDLPQKMRRLSQWCADATGADGGTNYRFLYVDQEGFERHRPNTFGGLAASFRDFQSDTGGSSILP